MSDIPELDRLLEEHRNFKTNVAFMRHERLFFLCCRVALTATIVMLACILVGKYGLAAITFAWALAGGVVPKPEWRDPFKRYKYL